MTLAKKNSRQINVAGAAYRWVLAPDDGYMVLVVQAVSGAGQKLEAFFRYQDLYEQSDGSGSGVVGQSRSVSPRIVRAVILAALDRGWQPSKNGLAAFRIRDADELIHE